MTDYQDEPTAEQEEAALNQQATEDSEYPGHIPAEVERELIAQHELRAGQRVIDVGAPPKALEEAVGLELDKQDGAAASKRAVRTLLQNVALDVLIAVVLVLYPIVSGASSLADFQWEVLEFLVGKTILVTVLSFVMRRFKVVPSTL